MRTVYLVSMIAKDCNGTESTYPLFAYENAAEAIRYAERLRNDPKNYGYTYAIKEIALWRDGNG